MSTYIYISTVFIEFEFAKDEKRDRAFIIMIVQISDIKS